MRYSQAFIPTVKEVPKDATMPSHVLMLRGGYARMVGAGIYELLPLGVRVLKKIERIIREEMDATGAQEISMPTLLPAEYFQETGRWDVYGNTLLRLKDRKGGDYHLAPTHEEIVTDLVRRETNSYRQLPFCLYQIQLKYRDEPRPRAGLLRCREFIMKDAYSFDVSEEAAQQSYAKMQESYHRIFKRLGLDYRVVEADSGAIGGSASAEFQVLVQTGEDDIVACQNCDFAANAEVLKSETCPRCGGPFSRYRGIEGGHIFVLGTHYSDKMNATFLDESGTQKAFVMGCYGIGVSRLIATIIEQHHDQDGICWPMSVAPYQVMLSALGKDAALSEKAEEIYTALRTAGLEVLYDDRDERPGVKFKDADLLGIPLRLTLGARGLKEGKAEIKPRTASEAEHIPLGEIVEHTVQRVEQSIVHDPQT